MPRASYSDLVVEVRAQIDVSDAQARTWLMDRSRVMNAESLWNLAVAETPSVAGQRTYALPPDCLWVEAVIVDTQPYQRSTLHQLDARWAGNGNTIGIYADSVDASGAQSIQLNPPPGDGSVIQIRYVADLADTLTYPPFPPDFDETIVDGAIAVGLARMDERFDSAGYFDARFTDAILRLKRRRNGHVGRGPVGIRIVG